MFIRITDTDGVERLVNITQIHDIQASTIEVEQEDGEYKDVEGVVINLAGDSFTVALTISVIDSMIQSVLPRFG